MNATDEQMDSIKELTGKMAPLPDHLKPFLEENELGWSTFKHRWCVMPMFSEMFTGHVIQMIKRKQELSVELLKEKDYGSYLFLHERPFRLEAFMEVMTKLTPKEYAEHLCYVWTDCEFPHVNNDMWSLLFRKAEGQMMMNEEEMEAYDKLPEFVGIYRGTGDRAYNGISWTTDKQKAIWFAGRFSEKRFLMSASVHKADIKAVFLGRGENEIIMPNMVRKFKREEIK